jgi:hypothetical protein
LQAGGHRFDPGHVHHFYWENSVLARCAGYDVTVVLPSGLSWSLWPKSRVPRLCGFGGLYALWHSSKNTMFDATRCKA